jgi:hypothetical protein
LSLLPVFVLVMLTMPHASDLLSSVIGLIVAPHWPLSLFTTFSYGCAVMLLYGQVIAGATLSSTVIVVVHVLLLPLWSVTVSVTVLTPTLSQVKSACVLFSVSGPQASVEPLSISCGVTVAWPFVFNWSV